MPQPMPQPETSQLENLLKGLLATPTARLPYQDNVLLRSYLLQRPAGNVIIYNSPGIGSAHQAIEELGGAVRLLINHAHEAMYGAPGLDVPVYVHSRDRAEVASAMEVAGVFEDRQMIDGDLEVIPTPGHTAGTASYLWDSGNGRFLFTGDFLWIEHGEWKAVVLDPSLRQAYLDSLALVRELDFDVLVPWGTTDDGPPFALAGTRAEIRSRVDAVINRVRAGGTR
ncbi:MBL fold metallo-hydrolase [Arthrobacter sp. zg-Y20]|uniref:MBL fold metallo-hydrolase n=1 Tax=unclassified Arthrobacter TaxID=235627 RepID=UPI001D14412A|nr:MULTISPECIES: MBL fold metallo-hydrolase [unclassified Arthrobacter]MCC3274483.1 MBL fold metallo-hydrolase [Arthrobacter sp. zg-Y20]MDK1314640.1 MBL fold metallo-hydrolase [Arthrobacter sp. zg.Y20]WIB07621.1 MBL fold metallo-hydrolase [Arthrobacter sp. zg-Y20]